MKSPKTDHKGMFEQNITKVIEEGSVTKTADMKKYTSFRVGGRADYLITVENIGELQRSLALIHAAQLPFMLLGNGSNVIVRDGGYRGVFIKLGDGFNNIMSEKYSVEDSRIVTAGAATPLAAVARFAAAESLKGFEFAGGIPGSIGGAAFMNAGAYGGELKDVIHKVDVVKKDGSQFFQMQPEQLNLGYRTSVFKTTGDIVTSVQINLSRGDKAEIELLMKELNSKRNAKQPVAFPSAGSFFKRPDGHFAGKLIEESGLKGLACGGAQVSELHAGFIINRGEATAADIENLMHIVQARVMSVHGVKLEPEVIIVGEEV